MITTYGPFFKKPCKAEDVPSYVLDKCGSCRKLLHDRSHFYTGGYQDTFYCSDGAHSVYKTMQKKCKQNEIKDGCLYEPKLACDIHECCYNDECLCVDLEVNCEV